MTVPRSEYPRPSLVRGEDSWLCLNGKWFFEVDNADSGGARELYKKSSLEKEIIVPFAPESKASGLELTDFMLRVWYCRGFVLPEHFDLERGRVLLHFGAMDYEGQVWINGAFTGSHRGGYTPCCFDITEQLQAGENRINVSCYDDTRSPLQPSGKQSGAYGNSGCFYTRCTGIWQTVWLEYVPCTYIKSVKLTPDIKGERLQITVFTSDNARVSARASLCGKYVSEAEADTTAGACSFFLPVPEPELWEPDSPTLYDLELTAGEDSVRTYFGMRSIEIDGNKVLLNGKSVFQRLVLDQGYYPEGIYTASCASDFARDIQLCKDAGFNGARMHMKIFEPGFIYEADRLGYLLWGEYPNWGLDIARPEAFGVMMPEWLEALERDYNSPAVIGWCPFNEAWPGESSVLFDTVYRVTKSYDPMRPVIDTSGYIHKGQTDIYDVHDYEQNPRVFASHYAPLCGGEGEVYINPLGGNGGYDGKKPYFVSEFGGAFFDMDMQSKSGEQESGNPWGYGSAPESAEEFCRRFEALCACLLDNPGVCGFCYTQFTDVMQEMNGLFAFDRRPKLDTERLRRVLSRPAAIEK